MFSSFVAYCATVMALLPLGSCLAESPDDRIPLEWRSGMAQNWDSTEIRYSLNWGDGKMSDQRIWTLDQIMEGEGYVCHSSNQQIHHLRVRQSADYI